MTSQTRAIILAALSADPTISADGHANLINLLEHPDAHPGLPIYATFSKLASLVGVSRDTLYRVRRNARAEGSIAFEPIEITPGNGMIHVPSALEYLDARRRLTLLTFRSARSLTAA